MSLEDDIRERALVRDEAVRRENSREAEIASALVVGERELRGLIEEALAILTKAKVKQALHVNVVHNVGGFLSKSSRIETVSRGFILRQHHLKMFIGDDASFWHGMEYEPSSSARHWERFRREYGDVRAFGGTRRLDNDLRTYYDHTSFFIGTGGLIYGSEGTGSPARTVFADWVMEALEP